MLEFHRESGYGKPHIADEFAWLHEQGIVFQPETTVTNTVVTVEEWQEQWRKATAKQAWANALLQSVASTEEEIRILTPDEAQKYYESIRLTWDAESHISRAYAAALRKQLGFDAVSLHHVPDEGDIDRVARRDDVLRVVVGELPVQDDGVSWGGGLRVSQRPGKPAQAARIARVGPSDRYRRTRHCRDRREACVLATAPTWSATG